jgi:cell division septation protein DedD
MTAFAFILGVVPLMIAHEAGAASQRSLGTAVGVGMFVATAIGVFLIPVLYASVQGMTEFVTRSSGKKPLKVADDATEHQPSHAPVPTPAPAPEPEPPSKKSGKKAKEQASAAEPPAAETPIASEALPPLSPDPAARPGEPEKDL